MLTILLIALSVLPRNDVVRDRVSILEVHHFYDENARLVFDQLIGWDAIDDSETVVFWRLIKHDGLIPRRDWTRGGYVVLFGDEGHPYREIRAPVFRERWTQWDVELENRTLTPVEKRRTLSGGRK